jgi:hypothetical protein
MLWRKTHPWNRCEQVSLLVAPQLCGQPAVVCLLLCKQLAQLVDSCAGCCAVPQVTQRDPQVSLLPLQTHANKPAAACITASVLSSCY